MRPLFSTALLSVVALLAAGPLFAADAPPSKKSAKKDTSPVLSHKLKSLDGQDVDLSKYKGKVLLIVNVASECGATPQYEPLQQLYTKYQDQGLVVLGFPCNQFGKQEPGTAAEIQSFCKTNYGVTFPMFAKVDVNGEQATGLYRHLTSKDSYAEDAGPVKWNFEKFLVSRDGKVVDRFRTAVQPDSQPVIEAIERELQK